MTTIKATCPSCGDVDLVPGDVVVTKAPKAGWAVYEFRCPLCEDGVRKPADEEVVGLLAGVGVRVDRIDVPAEALELHDGGRISHDDVLDFVLRLGIEDDLVGVLMAECGGTGLR